MTLQPLNDASIIIQMHAWAAMTALLLGVVQFLLRKGTSTHRLMGYFWVMIMFLVCVSSFWIHEIRTFGQWSFIHLLSVLLLVTVPMAIRSARRHDVVSHRKGMISLYCFALVVPGIFTFMPGRIMHAVVFG